MEKKIKKNKITRTKLCDVLNMMKSEYKDNKEVMRELDESCKQIEVKLKNNYAKKEYFERKLSSMKILDKLTYLQFVAFGLSIVSALLGAPAIVPIFVTCVTIAETISFAQRNKTRDVLNSLLDITNKSIEKEETNLKQLDSFAEYYAEKDLKLTRKIDCLTDYVYDQKHSNIFNMDEIFENMSKIEYDNEEQTK